MLLRNSRLLIVIYLFESFGNFAPVPTAVRCRPEFAAVRTAVTDAMVTYKASCRSRPLAVRSAGIQSPIAAMNCVKKTVTLKGGCEYFPRNADRRGIRIDIHAIDVAENQPYSREGDDSTINGVQFHSGVAVEATHCRNDYIDLIVVQFAIEYCSIP